MTEWLQAHGGTILVVLWDLIAVVAVPIAAAGLAALVVVRQVKQLDRHRTEDRRADGVIALTQMLIAETEIGMSPENVAKRPLLKMRTNADLIEAYAKLPAKDAPVARWAAMQRATMHQELDAAIAAGEITGDIIGTHRGNVQRIAAESMSALLDWRNGETETNWFKKAIKREREGL